MLLLCMIFSYKLYLGNIKHTQNLIEIPYILSYGALM